VIFLISVSWVARITDVSHPCRLTRDVFIKGALPSLIMYLLIMYNVSSITLVAGVTETKKMKSVFERFPAQWSTEISHKNGKKL
jgi:hypothetical protein